MSPFFSLLVLASVQLSITLSLNKDEQSNIENTDRDSRQEIRVGFLVGSQRAKLDRFYSRPGRQFVHAFNYAIDKINRLNGNATLVGIKFVPVLAETFGSESESIKQTIDLISRRQVNVIVGPQESCQVESKLATIFNIAMISHYCSLPREPSLSPQVRQQQLQQQQILSTFIQTKPPHWKIVQRVVSLVKQMLSVVNDWYPRQLVLLYFKEPSKSSAGGRIVPQMSAKAPQAATSAPTSEQRFADFGQKESVYLANDALQYKLIGELLEWDLNGLLSANQADQGSAEKTSAGREAGQLLTVLNWHTTFHYGFTKNPFRKIIRQHLRLQQSALVAANQSGHCYGSATIRPTTKATAGRLGPRAAIYIVVGHYYEHLGLMQALDELNLLNLQQQQQQQQPGSQLHSSVMLANQPLGRQHQSVVIGVDIEQYDERDDSVRFLRGLLMDENGNERQAGGDLDSIATMYRRYMGVVPAKPTRMADFLEGIRALYLNQSSTTATTPTATATDSPVLRQRGHSDEEEQRAALLLAQNQTLDSIQLTTRLFQFLRLPVETFYLYDSLMLLNSYFNTCINDQKLNLSECSSGRRVFEWFRNRQYSSFVNQNLTKFDSNAQSEGSYTLITRRLSQSNESSELTEDEFGLVPVGRFESDVGEDGEHKIELSVDPQELDQVWFPLWCHVRKSNATDCLNLLKTPAEMEEPSANFVLVILSALGITFVLSGIIIANRLLHGGFCSDRNKTRKAFNSGWFSEADSRNFLEIVHKFLLAPDTCDNSKERLLGQKCLIELHCYMFPFPICKFVHWITALHQLKEMMFRYQSSSALAQPGKQTSAYFGLLQWRRPIWNFSKGTFRNNRSDEFFTTKHRGTASLRLLLNKYKAINECFRNLCQIKHESIVTLYGATLSYNVGGGENKVVHLIVELPGRGNMRQAFARLREIAHESERKVADFKSVVLAPLIEDLLNGVEFLHHSNVEFHGELSATNCMVSVDWRLKLSGFHALHMRRSLGRYEENKSELSANSKYMEQLVYAAPEILQCHSQRSAMSGASLKLADIYSVGFIIYELLVDHEPWACLTQVTSSKLLVERVKVDSSFRPPLSRLDNKQSYAWPPNSADRDPVDLDAVRDAIRSCWSQSPDRRPQTIALLRKRMKMTMDVGQEFPPIDKSQAVSFYTEMVESMALNRGKALLLERRRLIGLKFNHLPPRVSSKLRKNEQIQTESFECVSFCQFRLLISDEIEQNPIQHMEEFLAKLEILVDSYRKHLHLLDSQVDSGLRYLVYSGEPLLVEPVGKESIIRTSHSQLVASFALQLIDLANQWNSKYNSSIQVKCALHCGPVLGGLLPPAGCSLEAATDDDDHESSAKLARYVFFGSTLRLVDMLEAASLPQRIQISAEFRVQVLHQQANVKVPFGFDGIDSRQGYVMIKRESKITAKNFADLEAHWLLNGPRLTANQSLYLSTYSQSFPLE